MMPGQMLTSPCQVMVALRAQTYIVVFQGLAGVVSLAPPFTTFNSISPAQSLLEQVMHTPSTSLTE